MKRKQDKALQVEKDYQDIEYQIIILTALYLNIETFEDISEWQQVSLEKQKQFEQEVKSIIATTSTETKKKLDEFIDNELMKSSNKFDKTMQYIIDSKAREYISPQNAIRETKTEVERIIYDSMNKLNRGVLNGANKVYKDIIKQAIQDVSTGTKTIDKAVSDVIKKWATKGIPSLMRKDGAMLTPDGYVPMVLRAAQKNLSTKLQEKRMDEYDIDLVMISSHMGSRPSHAPYQAKIYSRSGNSEEYDSLESTGYGKIDGLITGINCRHVMYPYIEGLSEQNYKEYDTKENDQRYKEQQYQRKLERDIRHAKRSLDALTKVGANEREIEKANQLVKNRQQRMREHIKDTGLTRRYERERIHA